MFGIAKKIWKNLKNRSKTIDKYAAAKYNIYIIKQNKLIKSNGKEGKPFGKTEKEKERQEKRTARTEANQIPNLWKCRSYHSNHSDNAFSNHHGGA